MYRLSKSKLFFLAIFSFCLITLSHADDSLNVDDLRQKAAMGNINAQIMLGLCYYKGEGVKQSYSLAKKWYFHAASAGNSNAQWRLGLMYSLGYGVNKNDATAVKWFRKSAEQGNAVGQVLLGYNYLTGKGVKKNAATAAKWFQKAASQDAPDGLYALALCYYYGDGVKVDISKAKELLLAAEKKGHSEAQKTLSKITNTANAGNTRTANKQAGRTTSAQGSGYQAGICFIDEIIDYKYVKIGSCMYKALSYSDENILFNWFSSDSIEIQESSKPSVFRIVNTQKKEYIYARFMFDESVRTRSYFPGAYCYLRAKINRGAYLILSDNSWWLVDRMDRLDSNLWLNTSNIEVKLKGGGYILINSDDDEYVHARYLGTHSTY